MAKIGLPRGTQAVGRAIYLLKLVGSSRVRNTRLVDIANMALLDKSTTHRLLQRLVCERLLTYDPKRGYKLGPLLFELGLAALPQADPRETARPALSALAQRTGDTACLVQRSGIETVCLIRIPGRFPIQTMTRAVGDRHPLGVGAGGLAILASLSDDDVQMIIDAIHPRLSSYGLTDRTLTDAVNSTREQGGVAVDDGRVARDVTAIGRMIPSRRSFLSTAIFVASLHERMTGNRRQQVDRALQECVTTMSRG